MGLGRAIAVVGGDPFHLEVFEGDCVCIEAVVVDPAPTVVGRIEGVGSAEEK